MANGNRIEESMNRARGVIAVLCREHPGMDRATVEVAFFRGMELGIDVGCQAMREEMDGLEKERYKADSSPS